MGLWVRFPTRPRGSVTALRLDLPGVVYFSLSREKVSAGSLSHNAKNDLIELLSTPVDSAMPIWESYYSSREVFGTPHVSAKASVRAHLHNIILEFRTRTTIEHLRAMHRFDKNTLLLSTWQT